MGDKVDVLIPLNQDSMDRHLRLMKAGSCVLYDGDRSEEQTSELQSTCKIARPLFFFNDTATTEIYTLSLHDALPICADSAQPGFHGPASAPDEGRLVRALRRGHAEAGHTCRRRSVVPDRSEEHTSELQ